MDTDGFWKYQITKSGYTNNLNYQISERGVADPGIASVTRLE
jgi:hypothetical protein